eukprot:m.735627 g.735627  ORF g.735627 m.735627 type:complete len:503 (-) comp23091_c0_seq9:2093-3601(-)
MLTHFQSYGTALKTVQRYPTTHAHEARLRATGWTGGEVTVDLDTFFQHGIDVDEKHRVFSLEPFDELEEHVLKCMHYGLSLAVVTTTGPLTIAQWSTALVPGSSTDSSAPRKPIETAASAMSVNDETRTPHRLCHTPQGQQKHSAVARRWNHASALIDESSDSPSVACFGGYGGEKQSRCHDMFFVDANGDTSAVKTSHQLNTTSSICPSASVGCTLTATRYGLLLFGGRTSPVKPTNDMFLWGGHCRTQPHESNAPVRAWEPVEHAATDAAGVPSARWRHTAVALDRDVVVVFGGRDAAGVVADATTLAVGRLQRVGVGAMVVWDATHGIRDTSFRARHSHTAVSWQGRMVVYGGVAADHTRLADLAVLERTDTAAWAWRALHLEGCPALPPRFAHASTVVGDTMLVVGGLGGTLPSPVEQILAIDLAHGNWRYVTVVDYPTPPPMWIRHSVTAVPVERCAGKGNDGVTYKLVIVGGGGNCFTFGAFHNRPSVSVLEGRAL